MIKALHFPPTASWDPELGYTDSIRPEVKASCQAIVLPVMWSSIQSTPASPMDETILATLDDRIRIASEDGLMVVLGCGNLPTWAAKPGYAPDIRRWSLWLKMLCERYAGQVRWMMPLNECNHGFALEGPKLAATVARMMKVAAATAASVPNAPGLLMPATLDLGSANRPFRWQGGRQGWWRFTNDVLTELHGWQPGHKVAWAHHAYGDIGDGLPSRFTKPRVAAVLDLLKKHNWRQKIYLTEQAYVFSSRAVGDAIDHWEITPPVTDQYTHQLSHLTNFWNWCEKDGRVEMFCHYERNFGAHGSGPWMSGYIDGATTDPPTITPFGKAWMASKTGIGNG